MGGHVLIECPPLPLYCQWDSHGPSEDENSGEEGGQGQKKEYREFSGDIRPKQSRLFLAARCLKYVVVR